MKKLYHFFLITAVVFFTTGCKEDEDPQEQPLKTPEVVVKEVKESLSGQANLSSFIAAFESLDITTEQVEAGMTIFAPLNEAIEEKEAIPGARISQSTANTLTPDLLKDHIAKGIFKIADLKTGDILTSLSGKELKVEVNGQGIWINGVLVSGTSVAAGEKHIVYTIKELFKTIEEQENEGIIEVTVWNGSKWSPEKSKGEKEQGVTVSLYNSHEEYALGNVAYTQETGADGKVTFNNLEIGKTYYIEAKKGDLSSTFFKSAQVENGVYTGMHPDGLFQNQEEVSSHATQPDGAPGNFRWKDLNGDGIINNSDRGYLPSTEAEIAADKTTEIEIIIGYANNAEAGPIKSGDAALQLLEDSYKKLDTWQKTLIMVDGILSDDAECGNLMNWCEIDNFTFGTTNATFTSIWQNAYSNIGQLNKLVRDVPNLSFAEKADVIAQARGLRAYIYLQLLTYFGNLPIQTGLMLDQEATQPSDEIYNYIVNELTSAAETLPAQRSSDKRHHISSWAAKALLTKAALWNKDFQKAADLSSQIIQSNIYELKTSSEKAFESASNSEIIWDFSFNLTSTFTDYFFGRTFAPAVRFAEIYLINAEAQFRLGNHSQSVDLLNLLRNQYSMTPIDSPDDLFETWKAIMSKEGVRFANLIRWDMATDILAPKGLTFKNLLLPVPQLFIDNHPNLYQNPGY